MNHKYVSPYVPRLAELVTARQLTSREKFFEVRLQDGSALGHQPGQFVEVSVFGVGEAPISVSSSPTSQGLGFELCVRDAGSVTHALHELPEGSTIGIRGPYGRGFPLDELKGNDLLFVAGGLGLVPMRSMINYAVDNRADFGRLTLLYGSRTPADLLFADETERWRGTPDFHVATTVDLADGAWTGQVGPITKLFGGVAINPVRTSALVVGPPVMFRFVLKSLLMMGVYESRVYLSLERRMKCGVGKCGHCQIDDVYVCQKGPVFPYTRVRKLPEAL
ncbi:MAG: FAD/NAD(P)-binding protein [Nitrospirae bacterium]|nr:FAD/NAD(P)-binding protein [Nitrospirota bacterium]